jgi:hypothetical protein
MPRPRRSAWLDAGQGRKRYLITVYAGRTGMTLEERQGGHAKTLSGAEQCHTAPFRPRRGRSMACVRSRVSVPAGDFYFVCQAGLVSIRFPPHWLYRRCRPASGATIVLGKSVHVHVGFVPAALASSDNGADAVLAHVRQGHLRSMLSARATIPSAKSAWPKLGRTWLQTPRARTGLAALRSLSWRVSPDREKFAEPVRRRRWSTQ